MSSLQINTNCQHYDMWIHCEDTNFKNINYQEKEPRGTKLFIFQGSLYPEGA
jgi:hypothetical protein